MSNKTDKNRSDQDKKKPTPWDRLVTIIKVIAYWQFTKARFEPQLQSVQAQFGLLHFT